MGRKRIAVLFGGRADTYRASLEAASACLPRIDRARYDVVPVGVERSSGAWHVFCGDSALIAQDRWLQDGRCVRVALSPDRLSHGLVFLGGRRVLRTVRLDVALLLLGDKSPDERLIRGAFELDGISVITSCELLGE